MEQVEHTKETLNYSEQASCRSNAWRSVRFPVRWHLQLERGDLTLPAGREAQAVLLQPCAVAEQHRHAVNLQRHVTCAVSARQLPPLDGAAGWSAISTAASASICIYMLQTDPRVYI